ncbi:hypothetical protein DFP72DRAFT_56995 [Ephemerocybe angulata]|uniref:MYND-type domain-containing protein n=1 Tax=Ephemerocybe angulata TaxID=980116 RepID=A0A8H6IAT2_9AGAR|nr:hypothetical protein DFP72DRAFT_56995 [Tulosesus angulatus]
MSRRGIILQKNEPPQPLEDLLDGATRGNRTCVSKLIFALMHDMKQYTAELLKAVISSIRPDLHASILEHMAAGKELPPHLRYAKETCGMALTSVYMAPIGCRMKVEELEPTLDVLKVKLPVLLDWMLVDLGHRPGAIDTSEPVEPQEPSFIWISGALRGLMEMHPDVEASILANPIAVDIALVLWSTLDGEEKPLFLSHHRFQDKAGCAIIDVILKFARDGTRERPSLLIQRLFTTPTPCDKRAFVARLFARGCLLQAMAQGKQDSKNYHKLVASTDSIIQLTQYLLVEHPDLFRADIVNSSPVLLHTRTLSRLLLARVDDDLRQSYCERVLDLHIFVFSQWVLNGSGSLTWNLLDSFSQGEMIGSIAFLLKMRGRSPEIEAKLEKLVDLVKTSLVFPKAVKMLHLLIFGNPEWGAPPARRGVKIPLVEARNEMLALCIDRKEAFKLVTRKVPFCDNISHRATAVPLNSKSCSKCQSVVYCSSTCQREDWIARHRDECRTSRQEYHDECQEERRYRQRLRARHLSVMMRELQESLKNRRGHAIASSSTAEPSIAIVDLRGYPVDMQTSTIRDFVAEFQPGVPKHLRKRFGDLVAAALEESRSDDSSSFRMVQAIVPYGLEAVYLTATVELTDSANPESKLKIVSSMMESRRKERAHPIGQRLLLG